MQSQDDSYQYRVGRGLHPSARLTSQHFLLQAHLGGSLFHSSIPLTELVKIKGDEKLQIADVGTGNGIWPCHVSATFSTSFPDASVAIDGSDISSSQFPPASNLPPNVTLTTMDIKSPISNEWEGKYDIVHVRYFLLVATTIEIPIILKNLCKMLKPNGYLLWIERDFHSHQPPSPPLSSTPRSTWTGWQNVVHYLRASSPSIDWIPHLETFFPAARLDVVHAQGYPPPAWLKHAWNENVLCAWVDIAARMQSEEEKREMQGWIAQAEMEVREEGYSPIWEVRVVVGRKR